MNKVILMGRLVADVQVNQAGGVSKAVFTVAVDRDFKNKQGEKEADFIRCIAWRQTADFVSKYFNKGKPICLVGSIRTGKYEKDGVMQYTTDVQVDSVEFVPGSANSSGSSGYSGSSSGNVAYTNRQQNPPPNSKPWEQPYPGNGDYSHEDFEEIGGFVPF